MQKTQLLILYSSQFTLFVTKEADIQCNPVLNDCGRGDNQKTNFIKHVKQPPRGHSFITETVPPDNKYEPCQYSKNPLYVLLNCRSFMCRHLMSDASLS